jgi:hypothetical protein
MMNSWNGMLRVPFFFIVISAIIQLILKIILISPTEAGESALRVKPRGTLKVVDFNQPTVSAIQNYVEYLGRSGMAQSPLMEKAETLEKLVQGGRRIAGRDKDPSDGETNDLSGILASFRPTDWEIFDEVKRFTPESLYEQINGRAEFFLSYDVVSMTFASYVNRFDVGQFIDISIYDMGSAINAFGVFSVERSQGQPLLELGRASYRLYANYYIWKGCFYITIISSQGTREFQRLGMDLARIVTDYLPDSDESIWGLTALPLKDRVPDSVQYFKVDAMGLTFMRNTFIAAYKKEDNTVTALLSQRDSAESAKDTVARYVEYAKEYGGEVKPLNMNDVELTSCKMGETYDVIFQKGRLIGGVWSVPDKDLAIQVATELYTHLPDERLSD